MVYLLAVIKLISSLLSMWTTRNKILREKKKSAMKEVVRGIKDKDPSRITAGFDRINRV